MSAAAFGANVSVILFVMAVCALIESVVPLFARPPTHRGRATANLGLTALTFLMSWALASAASLFALAFRDHGLASRLPTASSIVISIAALDFSTYVAHRAMHKIPFLWRVHRVHHSDPFLDVTSSFRQHPLEGIWRFVFIVVPALALGLSVEGVVAYRLVSAIQAVLEHANIRMRARADNVLSWLWCTPNMHKVHHSRAREQTDSNYGNIFSLFDRAFRSFRPTNEASRVRYGLVGVGAARATSIRALLATPFSAQDREI